MEKHINIIALNIPFPANYGGVIDIYYKLYAFLECIPLDRTIIKAGG